MKIAFQGDMRGDISRFLSPPRMNCYMNLEHFRLGNMYILVAAGVQISKRLMALGPIKTVIKGIREPKRDLLPGFLREGPTGFLNQMV
jgi:hypothetical protein